MREIAASAGDGLLAMTLDEDHRFVLNGDAGRLALRARDDTG